MFHLGTPFGRNILWNIRNFDIPHGGFQTKSTRNLMDREHAVVSCTFSAETVADAKPSSPFQSHSGNTSPLASAPCQSPVPSIPGTQAKKKPEDYIFGKILGEGSFATVSCVIVFALMLVFIVLFKLV